MKTSNSSDKELEIGTVFTPLKWGQFAIEQFGLFDKWLNGSKIFDPTMGEGNLLVSLIEYGLERDHKVADLPINNLYGVELNTQHFQNFFKEVKNKFDLIIPKENFSNEDIFFNKQDQQFDIMFGNPPWQNFVDLPNEYKERTKKLFFQYDLVENPKTLLLGGSRIDIAALVLQKTIEKNLNMQGEAIFFIPLSLLLNDGANKFFRKYKVNGINYCINKIFDFNDLDIFDGISTRYGLIHISKNKKQEFPIEYHRWEDVGWKNLYAQPVFNFSDPLSICDKTEHDFVNFNQIKVSKHAKPRQGINTCGANDIYFFDSYTELDNNTCKVSNKNTETILPKQYVFPLLTSKNFSETSVTPKKWVLIHHNRNGGPLSEKTLEDNELLWRYLKEKQNYLENRKGILINTWIKKGKWWALLGVGEYNFFPHKIVWEAYGKKTFRPKIFSGEWQANQSLQAFMPTKKIEEAYDIIKQLNSDEVENYLLSLKMEGTMNWAQPGKVKKMLIFKDENLTLFPAI